MTDYENTVNILFIHNAELPSMKGITIYAKNLCKKYNKDFYSIETFSLKELKEQDFEQIYATCYEGLYLNGIFTKDDLFWPVKRQRPRFEEVN